MSLEVDFIKEQGGVLRPADEYEQEKMNRFKTGSIVRVKTSSPRNIDYHRKYFWLLKITYANLPEGYSFETNTGRPFVVGHIEALRNLIKFILGHYEWEVQPTGGLSMVYKSMSFAKMDQFQFEKYFNDSVEAITKHILKGLAPQTLLDEIEKEFKSRR